MFAVRAKNMPFRKPCNPYSEIITEILSDKSHQFPTVFKIIFLGCPVRIIFRRVSAQGQDVGNTAAFIDSFKIFFISFLVCKIHVRWATAGTWLWFWICSTQPLGAHVDRERGGRLSADVELTGEAERLELASLP